MASLGGALSDKEPTMAQGDTCGAGFDPWVGISTAGGQQPTNTAYLENPMDESLVAQSMGCKSRHN